MSNQMDALFKRVFNSIKPNESRYQVFSDFAAMSSLSIENAFLKSVKLNDKFQTIRDRYSADDYGKMGHLLGITAQALQDSTTDFLGQVFMSLEIAHTGLGQFFTPDSVSKMCAAMTVSGASELLKGKRYISVMEPAAGAGGMLLHTLAVLREMGVDTDHRVFFTCQELHETASNLCYIQMSLSGAAAQVVTCNTLTNEVYNRRYTPVYYLCNWRYRLSLPPDITPNKKGKVIKRTRRV